MNVTTPTIFPAYASPSTPPYSFGGASPVAVADHQNSTMRPGITTFVLAWEDVLVPMTFLTQRIGLKPTKNAMAIAKTNYVRDAYLQQALAVVEAQAIEVLRVAASMGSVFVLTDKSQNYMDATSAAFFPRLAHWLANANLAAANDQHGQVRIVAAPTKFTSDMEAAAWRVQMFQLMCKAAVCDAHGASLAAPSSLGHAHRMLQFQESGVLGLVSVSASDLDRLASWKTVEVAPFLVPKCVKVQGGEASAVPSLEYFFAQLRTLQQYVTTAANHGGAFAVTL